jgi:hypothetical protein
MIEENAFLERELKGGDKSHLPLFIEMVRRSGADRIATDQVKATFSEAFASKRDRERYLAEAERFTPLPVDTYRLLASSSDWKLSFSDTGRGISAVRPFASGERVAGVTGVATIDSSLVVEARAFEAEHGDEQVGTVLNNVIQIAYQRYLCASGITGLLNHSCDPNVAFVSDGRGFAFRALRPIGPNEALTYDYASVISDCFLMECLCRAPNCRGIASRTFVLSGEARAQFLLRYPTGWLLDFIEYEAQYTYDPEAIPPELFCRFFEGTELDTLLRHNPHFDPVFKAQILEHLRSKSPPSLDATPDDGPGAGA